MYVHGLLCIFNLLYITDVVLNHSSVEMGTICTLMFQHGLVDWAHRCCIGALDSLPYLFPWEGREDGAVKPRVLQLCGHL